MAESHPREGPATWAPGAEVRSAEEPALLFSLLSILPSLPGPVRSIPKVPAFLPPCLPGLTNSLGHSLASSSSPVFRTPSIIHLYEQPEI